MRIKTLFYFKAKVIDPCSKFLSIFKHKSDKPSMSSRTPTFRISNGRSKPKIRTVRFRKPFSMKAFRFPHCRRKTKLQGRKNRPSLSSKFKKSFRRKKQTKQPKKPVQKGMGEPRSTSASEGGHAKEPFPSPITPGYVRISDDSMKESSNDLEDVEDACKSFENYMVEMIIEEGKLKDLMDVEELLYCWRNLKSPVFIDLVSRFYGELCKDLFSPSEENGSLETSESQDTNNTSSE